MICAPLFSDPDDEFALSMRELLIELDTLGAERGVRWSAFELMEAAEWSRDADHFAITRAILNDMIATRWQDILRLQELDELGHR